MSPYHWGFCYAVFCKQANVARQQSSQDQQYRRNVGTALTGLGALSTLGSGVAGGLAAGSQYLEDAPWQKKLLADGEELIKQIQSELAQPERKDWTPEQQLKYTTERSKLLEESIPARRRAAVWRSLRVPALAGVGSLGLMGTGIYLHSTSR
jgi:hypothetical protein